MKVRIDIGALVLDGVEVPPHQRPALQAAVEGELARLIREGGTGDGVPAAGWQRTDVAASISIAPGAVPQVLGGRIAAAVYGSLWP